MSFRSAARDLDGVTARLEGRVLAWMAARLPVWIHSDHLTALALAAMIAAGLAYWAAATSPWALWVVNVCLAVNWFGDSLDGTVARLRRRERPRYGFYVDHVVDAAGAVCLVGGMALGGLLAPLVAATVLSAYLLLSVEVYLATYCLGRFRLSFWKIGPTELRVLLALANAGLFYVGPVRGAFDVGGIIATAGLIVTFIVSAIRNTRRLYALEPIDSRVDNRAAAEIHPSRRAARPSAQETRSDLPA